MKASLLAARLWVPLLGCGTTQHSDRPLHHEANTARPPYVDIAVNLGLKHAEDLHRLYDSLASAGVRCGLRAMSLNAEQIVVEREDFDHAKAIVTGIIVRDKLTVRVYESVDFAEAPTTSLLGVWEHGKKTREETYKLYLE